MVTYYATQQLSIGGQRIAADDEVPVAGRDDAQLKRMLKAGLIYAAPGGGEGVGTMTVVDAGADDTMDRPEGALAVYWLCDAGITPVNATAGDIIFNADA